MQAEYLVLQSTSSWRMSAKVLFDYSARTPQEVSVKAGEVVQIVAKHDSGWWVVELNGNKGAIPGSYCKEKLESASSALPPYIAKGIVIIARLFKMKSLSYLWIYNRFY